MRAALVLVVALSMTVACSRARPIDRRALVERTVSAEVLREHAVPGVGIAVIDHERSHGSARTAWPTRRRRRR